MAQRPCVKYLKALGDPTRLEIVRLLFRGSQCVTDLAEALGIGVARTSYHLTTLKHAGVVTEERQGQFIYYHLEPEIHDSIDPETNRLTLGCCELSFSPGFVAQGPARRSARRPRAC
jgi:DNA-binding transcriptional ArsR family regulator